MEADYLKRVVGGCLAEGVAEVSTVKPSDPIEYLALWILKHKQNLKQAELARVEESQHEEGVAVGAEGEQQAEPTLTTAATGELHSAGLTPGKGSESGQSAPTPTILVEVPERKTSGKLSRIEEEKEEELARFADLHTQSHGPAPPTGKTQLACKTITNLASYPGLLTPAFVACSSNMLVLQMTTTGVRRPGYEAITNLLLRVHPLPLFSYRERDDTVELPKQEHSPDQT